jgi:hypothetical protein
MRKMILPSDVVPSHAIQFEEAKMNQSVREVFDGLPARHKFTISASVLVQIVNRNKQGITGIIGREAS